MISTLNFVFGFMTGAILGSFAAMLAYRLPRRLSIVAPRSHCTSCDTTLSVRDLVPLFSWLALKGHCRYCNAEISAKYFFIELAISFACGVASALIGLSPWLLIAYICIVAVIVALAIKFENK